MKKLLAFILVLALMIPFSAVSAASLKPDASIKVFLNGKGLTFDINPVQTKGTTLVQFTTIFKALGLNYTWDQETKTINAYNDEIQLQLTLNEKVANVNGYNVGLDVAPVAYQGKTLVPLRFVSEATGMKVVWDGKTKKITISDNPNKKLREVPTLDKYTFGAKTNDSSANVTKLLKQKATHPYGNEIFTYNNIDFGGYKAELNLDFIYDEFYGASYYVGKNGLDDDYLVTYITIHEELEKQFGVPNKYEIIEILGEDEAPNVIDWDINMQLLRWGIENNEYQIISHWDLPQGLILLNLYQDINANIIIEGVFYPY